MRGRPTTEPDRRNDHVRPVEKAVNAPVYLTDAVSTLLKCFNSETPFFTLTLFTLLPTVQMCVYDQENFQGRCIEINGECMNVCDMGMDRVRSLRVSCGP